MTRWANPRRQRQCDATDPDEDLGTEVDPCYGERLQEQVQETKQKLQKRPG